MRGFEQLHHVVKSLLLEQFWRLYQVRRVLLSHHEIETCHCHNNHHGWFDSIIASTHSIYCQITKIFVWWLYGTLDKFPKCRVNKCLLLLFIKNKLTMPLVNHTLTVTPLWKWRWSVKLSRLGVVTTAKQFSRRAGEWRPSAYHDSYVIWTQLR